MTRIWQFFGTYWRGQYALVTILAILVICRTLSWLWIEQITRPELIWPLIVLGLLLTVWLIVGAWRRADESMRAGGAFQATLIYAIVFLVGIVTLEQSLRLATRGESVDQSPIPRTELSVNDGAITLAGPIDFAMFEAFEAQLAQVEITRVLLQSNGGNVHAARGLARLIQEAKLSTRAIGPCRSACSLVFLAGISRDMTDQASIGFHSYNAGLAAGEGKISIGDAKAELERDLAWMRSRGVSSAFTAKISKVPHQEMWHPSGQELLAAGVLTR